MKHYTLTIDLFDGSVTVKRLGEPIVTYESMESAKRDFLEVSYFTKRDLMRAAFGEDLSGIDSAIPQHVADKRPKDVPFLVMDFRNSIFGELKDLREVGPFWVKWLYS